MTTITSFVKSWKLASVVATTLLATQAVTAQKIIPSEREGLLRFGVKAGVNINKITGQAYKSGFNYNFQGGGFMQINFSKRVGIQPELSFVQTSSEFSNDPNNVYDDIFNGGNQHKAKLDYLEVPVLLNINLGESKRVKLQFGPSYGALLSQTVDSLKNKGDVFKNGEWSGIGGLWIQLPLVNISARYKIGFSDINNIDDRQTWKNQAIQISAGITF
ncbi:porin family protein [Ferruginibacter yonginensis]|uniref:Porin family protein n=1 Tax=Ferruginibacter yonginensis TaxID=1310416 RepID=A0ABV8QPR4_9BACT